MSSEILCDEKGFCHMDPPMDNDSIPSDLNLFRETQEKVKRKRRRVITGGGKLRSTRVP